ncbi:unnamed protein product [Lactuca virosa]|uniref:RBR-type E3 ubiquitin transferase n=1 Tax=Lactuca virosa TaxID=75947 RepID=A0AAU9MEG9_9ASTR|nr:unnamed protein product [Lactuca virosa]
MEKVRLATDSVSIAACGHHFCNTCWVAYISTCINDGRGCLNLRCPIPSCGAVVGVDMVNMNWILANSKPCPKCKRPIEKNQGCMHMTMLGVLVIFCNVKGCLVNALLSSLEIDNHGGLVREHMPGRYAELDQYWGESQVMGPQQHGGDPNAWALSFERQHGAGGWASEHQSKVSGPSSTSWADQYAREEASKNFLLLKLLASHKRITIVGDEDQSIFSFNGANVSGFKSFRKDFQPQKEVRLNKNYRSTRCIVDAALFLIQNNSKRCRLKKGLTDKSSGSKLEYDILEYVVIERLVQGGHEKLKDDGLNLSYWLQSLASFWGHLFSFPLHLAASFFNLCS